MPQKGIIHKHYSPAFKLSVVEEYLEGFISKKGLCRKYSLSCIGLLNNWIRIFAPEPLVVEEIMDKSAAQEEILRLRRELKLKDLELKRAVMRADLLDELIHVAEEQFNIPVRKKAGTKR